jgi:hypothetical protein
MRYTGTMETIYDHKPTTDEMRYISGASDAEEYRLSVTEDEALAGLCMLFAMRGDGSRSEAYARRISDQDWVRLNLLNHDLISPNAAVKSPNGADNKANAA